MQYRTMLIILKTFDNEKVPKNVKEVIEEDIK